MLVVSGKFNARRSTLPKTALPFYYLSTDHISGILTTRYSMDPSHYISSLTDVKQQSLWDRYSSFGDILKYLQISPILSRICTIHLNIAS